MTYRPAKPSVLVPSDYQAEVAMMTKNELMDLVWDYAMQIARVEHPHEFDRNGIRIHAFAEIRQRRDNVLQRRRKVQQGSK